MAAPRPQYPFWVIHELKPENMAAIRQLTGLASNNAFFELLANIANTQIDEHGISCEHLLRPRPDAPAHIRAAFRIENFYSKQIEREDDNYAVIVENIRHFVVFDIALRLPVGYMSINTQNDTNRAIFQLYDGGSNNEGNNNWNDDIQAYGIYIDFSCSFTMSPFVMVNGQTIAAYYAAKLPIYTISLAKFMHNTIANMLLAEVNANNDEEIRYVLFYSLGVEESRPRHRKNGKVSACNFMDDWNNAYGQNPQQVFGIPDVDKPSMMYYLYMPEGRSFVGSHLYNILVDDGRDISVPNAGAPGDPGYYNDDNFHCLHANNENSNEEMDGGRRRKRRKAKSTTKKLTRHSRHKGRTRKHRQK